MGFKNMIEAAEISPDHGACGFIAGGMGECQEIKHSVNFLIMIVYDSTRMETVSQLVKTDSFSRFELLFALPSTLQLFSGLYE